MDRQSVLEVLAQFRKALAAHGIADARMMLFGSHARADAREDSDIDVVVISDAFEGMTHWERITVLSKAICASHVLIEAVAMTDDEWARGDSLIASFAREGEEVPV